jgi:branched-subunit amino acid transport protein
MLSLGNVRLLAGAPAGSVAWQSTNVFLAIAVGTAAMWLFQAVLPN